MIIDGLIKTASDKSGTTSFEYDQMNNLTEKTQPDGLKLKYEYDSSQRLTKIITPFGYTIYVYDVLDRLVKVIDKDNQETLYFYDSNGNRESMKYANGVTTSYMYDTQNRLTLQETEDKTGKVISSYKYTLGKTGERLKVEELERVVQYKYDNLYRLTQEKITKGTENKVIDYTYDKVSNRLTKTENGVKTEYTYNDLNQLIKETGITYKYDLNGNLIEKKEQDETTKYTFDNSNRLIRATMQKGTNVAIEEYKYDFAGNRIYKGSELSGTKYLIDTNNWISLVVAEMDDSNAPVTYYSRGAELINLERAGEKSYYVYDGQGSTRKLVSQSGAVTDTYTYDGFGNTLEKTGVTQNEFLYNGEQFDSSTGLYYLRARYMSPSTGLFISMDAYQGNKFDPMSLHKYLYANANPIMNEDPTGYMSIADITSSLGIQSILDGIAAFKLTNTFKNLLIAAKVINVVLSIHSVITTINSGNMVDIMLLMASFAVSMLAFINICEMQMIAKAMIAFLGGLSFGNHVNVLIEGFKEDNLGKILGALLGMAIDLSTIFKACFTGETLVYTEDGYKRIDEIKVGNYVWSYNVETGETELKEVLEVYEKETDELVYVSTEDEETISTTSTHPFYVVDKGWVASSDLRIGDKLYSIDGTENVITDLGSDKFAESVKVYNLNVDGFHSYFVSDDRVLVHNASCKPNSSGSAVPVKNATKASNKLYYQSNGKHTPGQPGFRPNAGIEPSNSLDLFGQSVTSTKKPDQRFTYDKVTGTLHRFFDDGNSIWHWSGSTNQGANSLPSSKVPIDIIRLFGLPTKGW